MGIRDLPVSAAAPTGRNACATEMPLNREHLPGGTRIGDEHLRTEEVHALRTHAPAGDAHGVRPDAAGAGGSGGAAADGVRGRRAVLAATAGRPAGQAGHRPTAGDPIPELDLGNAPRGFRRVDVFRHPDFRGFGCQASDNAGAVRARLIAGIRGGRAAGGDLGGAAGHHRRLRIADHRHCRGGDADFLDRHPGGVLPGDVVRLAAAAGLRRLVERPVAEPTADVLPGGGRWVSTTWR